MVEKSVISHVCPNCKKFSYPLGHKEVELPFMDPIICPFCRHQVEGYVLDAELTKEKLKKDLGLYDKQSDNSRLEFLNKRLDAVEAKLNSINTEQELLRTKLDILTKDEIQKIKENASDHNFNLNGINERMGKVEEQIEHAKKYGKFKPD